MLRFEILDLPPSVNKIYFQHGHARIKTTEYRSWEALCAQKVQRLVGQELMPIYMELQFYSPLWITKSGSANRRDLSNFIKAAEDGIFNALGIDDKWVFSLSAKKIPSKERKTVVIIHFNKSLMGGTLND